MPVTYPTIDLSSYPPPAEIEARLKSLAFWPTTTAGEALARRQVAIAAIKVADAWEEATDWGPYLVGYDASIAANRRFHNADQYGYLNLNGAAQSIASVKLDGVTLTLNTDYVAAPEGAMERVGRPITGIQFIKRGLNIYRRTTPYGIVVNSTAWGYCTAIPADVYETLISAAGLCALLGVENPRDVSNLSQDGFSVAFDPVGPIDPKTVLASLGKNYPKAVAKHRRPS